MGSKIFLYINAAVILLFIIKMIAGRKQGRPTPLIMGEVKPPLIPKEETEPPYEAMPNSAPNSERSLNCVFVFNGHTFDVFEVLGIPAGSSHEACLRAAIDLRRRSPTDEGFLSALNAAIDKKKPR